MVIVYPDAVQADAARQRDTRLVDGYGPATWQANVALLQITRAELARRYQPSSTRTIRAPSPAPAWHSRWPNLSLMAADLVAVLLAPAEASL